MESKILVHVKMDIFQSGKQVIHLSFKDSDRLHDRSKEIQDFLSGESKEFWASYTDIECRWYKMIYLNKDHGPIVLKTF